jgi:hypothetical protein
MSLPETAKRMHALYRSAVLGSGGFAPEWSQIGKDAQYGWCKLAESPFCGGVSADDLAVTYSGENINKLLAEIESQKTVSKAFIAECGEKDLEVMALRRKIAELESKKPAPFEIILPELDESDVDDLAGSSCQEALSFGINQDVFARLVRGVHKRTLNEVSRLNPVITQNQRQPV